MLNPTTDRKKCFLKLAVDILGSHGTVSHIRIRSKMVAMNITPFI